MRNDVAWTSRSRPPKGRPQGAHLVDCPEYGRGLLLIEVLADRWGVDPRAPSGKTVRAELPVVER